MRVHKSMDGIRRKTLLHREQSLMKTTKQEPTPAEPAVPILQHGFGSSGLPIPPTDDPAAPATQENEDGD